ncbi:succinate CoA transferase [Olivibacter domesticus]|uniref:Acetyl-CoA hydrolase n=1 Tax=Olivibacter domesticus TaxID=407022 RepID=A0A1H7V570_OLID1|nr:succinate CoA transferase [Olivibacter domesticus]SEM04209.1 acetyl-CoA hydrolase [Olivibacter domesticus]
MDYERIKHTALQHKITTVDKVLELFKDGAVVASSGFTKAGDSKVVLPALAARNKDYPIQITLITGASLGNDTDAKLTSSGILKRRMPFQVDRVLRQAINNGEVLFVDQNLSETSEMLTDNQLPTIDVAIIEAAFITAEGDIVPTTSVGNSPIFAQKANKIIIEINTAVSTDLHGLHDIYIPEAYPNRKAINIFSPNDRIGANSIKVDPEKIAAIVFSNQVDSPADIAHIDTKTAAIASHLIRFLTNEVASGRLTKSLRPLQAGIGKVANAVLASLEQGDFEGLTMFSEVLQDSSFDLIDSGKLMFASAASITVSEACYQRVFNNLEKYRDKIVLRPQSISNAAEVIRRLGVIGINTAIEFDIYGNVNSSHIGGTHMMNGIGGSGDFARNAHMSIFVTQAASKGDSISHILPMVSHVDHNEHNVDVVVTDMGYADLRGLAPRERALKIIQNCAHPDYKDALQSYFDRAVKEVGGQTPHLLEEAFSWHTRLKQTGTMKHH